MDDKAINYTRERLVREASAAGSQLIDAQFVSLGDPTHAAAHALKLLAPFKTSHGADSVLLLRFTHPQIGEHVYVQPFESFSLLPGEHVASIRTAIPTAFAALRSRFQVHGGRARPFIVSAYILSVLSLAAVTYGLGLLLFLLRPTPAIKTTDAELARALGRSKRFKKSLRKLKWMQPLGRGVIVLNTILQARPVAPDLTQVVLHSADYGRKWTLADWAGYQVGFAAFVETCLALSQVECAKPTQASPFVAPTPYADLAQARSL